MPFYPFVGPQNLQSAGLHVTLDLVDVLNASLPITDSFWLSIIIDIICAGTDGDGNKLSSPRRSSLLSVADNASSLVLILCDTRADIVGRQ